MSSARDKNFVVGVTAIGVGLFLAISAGLWAHFTGLAPVDNIGRAIYPNIPRGWGWVLIGQLLSVGGLLIAMAGATLAFLYERKMTWARAALGALLFTGLMIILYGIIPNQWLTYTQAVWEWSGQKIWVTIPSGLIGGNVVNISADAVKDMISGGYAVVITVLLVITMIRWQKRDELRTVRAPEAPPQALSAYGRPVRKVER